MEILSTLFIMTVSALIIAWFISDAIKDRRYRRKKKKEADKRRAETERKVIELHKNKRRE